MWRVVGFLCMLALVNGQNTNGIVSCVSNAGELPIHVYIEGCEQTPCPMPRGSEAIIHMVFQTPRTIQRMQTYATAHILWSTIPYPLGENAEACNFLTNSYCPVLQNEVLQYTLRMGIETSFPLITVTIEFRIEDDDGQSFVCIRLPVTVTAAVNQQAVNGTTTHVSNV